MAFEGRKDELLAVIGCGMNRLDRAKLVSNATRTWDKRNALCQPLHGSWRNDSHLYVGYHELFVMMNNRYLHNDCTLLG